jgi:hypothetical protein
MPEISMEYWNMKKCFALYVVQAIIVLYFRHAK